MTPRRRRGFGAIRRLPSGRFQAHYTGPDTLKHQAATTFATREDAEAWLYARRNEISEGAWTASGPPKRTVLTFGAYAATWLGRRQLKPRTRSHYRSLLDAHIIPTFGDRPMKTITPEQVAVWHTTSTPALRPCERTRTRCSRRSWRPPLPTT